MTGVDNQLFTVEEALFRLGQNKAQGCLVAANGAELVTIYVQNGLVLDAHAGQRIGKEAVEFALHLKEASYQWMKGVQSPNPSPHAPFNLQELILLKGNIPGDNLVATGKMKLKPATESSQSQYQYFLVPEAEPTTKLFLNKTVTVLGRTKSSDLVIEDYNISSRHCLLDIHNRGLFILDLDSTNGTYVNGVLVKDGYINPGDVLELGSYRMTINRELRK